MHESNLNFPSAPPRATCTNTLANLYETFFFFRFVYRLCCSASIGVNTVAAVRRDALVINFNNST